MSVSLYVVYYILLKTSTSRNIISTYDARLVAFRSLSRGI